MQPPLQREAANLATCMNRRRFLQSLAVAGCVPRLVGASRQLRQLPLSFSTLGCPAWDWATILQRASRWGYAAIELRGLQGEMDLTRRPEFQGSRLTESRKDLAAANLRIVGLGASARMHESDPAVRKAQLDEGRRFVDLAQRLGALYVRVFGDRVPPGQSRPATVERIGAGLRELGTHAVGSGVTVLLESHGDFCDSATLLEILSVATLPSVGLLWDTHHTVVTGKETPATTWRQLGQYVRHVHLKDSKPEGKGVKYVLTGQGTVPVREIVQLLAASDYPGCLSFEWEKAWHPEIEDPEVAFPQFARVIRGYLEEESAGHGQ